MCEHGCGTMFLCKDQPSTVTDLIHEINDAAAKIAQSDCENTYDHVEGNMCRALGDKRFRTDWISSIFLTTIGLNATLVGFLVSSDRSESRDVQWQADDNLLI